MRDGSNGRNSIGATGLLTKRTVMKPAAATVAAALAMLALAGSLSAHLYPISSIASRTEFQVQSSTGSGTTRVSVALYLIDLIEINGSDQSFLADIFLRARWHDDEMVGRFDQMTMLDVDDVWRPVLLFVNQRGVNPTLPEVVRVAPNGTVQYAQRFTGRFSTFLDLRDFPLDRQSFYVWVVGNRLSDRDFDVVPDTSMVRLANDRLSIADWRIGDIRLQPAEFRATPTAEPLSGVKITINAQRRVGYYIIQVVIPLVAIVMMAWTVFWIDPSVVATRVSVVVTTMLTLIAYRFMLGNHVPRLSYLTRLDYFMLGATTLIIIALFAMAGASFLKARGRDDLVARIDRVGRAAFPVVFLAFALFVWLS